MTEKVLISKTIDNLRFPLTVGVVFIHFYIGNGLNISGISHGMDNPNWYYFIVNIVSLVFAQISVPLFFVISGFLFFLGLNDFNSNQYIRKLKKRVKTLLVPYILWNIIAIVWEMKCFIPFLSAYIPPVELKFSVIRIINTFICESNNMGIFIHTGGGLEKNVFPIHVPFWYVRDLILFVVLTPAIYRFIKYGGGIFILLLGLIWFLTPMLFPSGGYLRMFVKGFFFFSFGAYFSINKIRIVPLLQKLNYSPIVYLLLALLDVLTLDHEWHEYVHEIGMWVGVISVTYLFLKLAESNKYNIRPNLINSSFFIYALHCFIVGPLGKVIFIKLNIPDNNPIAMLLLYFSVPVLTVIICYYIYKLLKIVLPTSYVYLTGGR